MKINLVLVFISLSIASYSQYSFGLKGGGSYCNLIPNSEAKEYVWGIEYGYKVSYQIGIAGRIALNNTCRVDMELLYADKGYGELHLTYIDLPVLFQYNVLRRLSIGAGTEFGFFLSSYYKRGNTRFNGSRFGNPFDLSALFGLEYQLTDKLGLSLRYVKGMANVLNAEGRYYSTSGPIYYDFSGEKVTNSSFQASLSYWLRSSEAKLSDKPAFT